MCKWPHSSANEQIEIKLAYSAELVSVLNIISLAYYHVCEAWLGFHIHSTGKHVSAAVAETDREAFQNDQRFNVEK